MFCVPSCVYYSVLELMCFIRLSSLGGVLMLDVSVPKRHHVSHISCRVHCTPLRQAWSLPPIYPTPFPLGHSPPFSSYQHSSHSTVLELTNGHPICSVELSIVCLAASRQSYFCSNDRTNDHATVQMRQWTPESGHCIHVYTFCSGAVGVCVPQW